jgi:hypothetical protein
MQMNIQCDQFEQILEQQQDDGRLPKPALDHIEVCDACRALSADLDTILGIAVELGAEGVNPPERVWIALRNQLEAEQLIRSPKMIRSADGAVHDASDHAAEPNAWWTVFQRPALAGAFLSLILLATGMVMYQGGVTQVAFHPEFAPEEQSPTVLSAETIFKEEMLNVGSNVSPGAQKRDAAVTDSIRRNLGVVDNFIAMCEKSVREQPDNEVAREYLYGAYQQKAELLATAMNRSVAGGLQ